MDADNNINNTINTDTNKETGFWAFWLKKADTMKDQIEAWDKLCFCEDWERL